MVEQNQLDQMRENIKRLKDISDKLGSDLDAKARNIFGIMVPQEVVEYVNKNNAYSLFGIYLNKFCSSERAYLLGQAFDKYAEIHKG